MTACLDALACSPEHDASWFDPSVAAGGSAVAGSGPAGGSGGTAGSGGATLESDPAARFFEADRLLEVELAMAADDWDALRKEKRSLSDVILGQDCQESPFASPFTWKRADVAINGGRVSSVGVRKKGFLGSLDEERPSLKIATDEYFPQDLFGVRDFTLNNVHQDPGIIGECLAFSFFAKAGLAAPRCNFAHVTVNGRDLGVYAHVEPMKKPFLRRHFTSDSGDLYEGTLSDFRAGWLGTFDPKTDETDPHGAPLAAIAAALTVPEAELVARLRTVIDLDAFLRFWATETAVAHVDGYARNTNNFFSYRDPGSSLTTLLPWGADQVFGNASGGSAADPIRPYTEGMIAHALYATPEGRRLMLDKLRALLVTAWNETEIAAEAERMATLVRPHITIEQSGAFEEAQRVTLDFVWNRRATLEEAITSPPSDALPLREPVCLRPIGSVSGSFDTTWGTIGAQDPFSSGKGVLNVSVDGVSWQHRDGFVGAVAGENLDPAAARDSQVVVPASRTDGMVSVMAFGFDHTDAVPGSLNLDLDRAPGVLLQLDPNMGGLGEVVGVLADGTLSFERIATRPGDAVVGRFAGTLYSTGLLQP